VPEMARRSTALSAEELLAQGWKRCFIADEPRLSEAVETYEELGLEVLLLQVMERDAACTECMKQAPERFFVIYTRPRGEAGEDLP
jgi:cytosine/adenosine deaminase-related metal-dependent hydrolase